MILIVKNNEKGDTVKTIPKLINFFESKKIPIMCISNDYDIEKILKNKKKITGVILSGGNMRLTSEICLNKIIKSIYPILELKVPILGICLGFQILALIHGGQLEKLPKKRKFNQSINIKIKGKLFKDLDKNSIFYQNHNDFVKKVPSNIKILATSNNGKIIQAFKHKEKELYGVQFHPEMSNENGEKLLYNFLSIL